MTIFNNLVHTEETRMRVDIRQYDMKGVTMVYERGLYVLQVPGLAEKRPSVLRGDIVKVKLHDDHGSEVVMYPYIAPSLPFSFFPFLCFISFSFSLFFSEIFLTCSHDGYAHYVNLDNVHVSFHRDIYNYVARKYKFDVQFTFNRTPLRLFHRSLNISSAMWQKLATPAKPARPLLPLPSFFGKVVLNPEQGRAVVTILHNSEAPIILHGPPGTGSSLFHLLSIICSNVFSSLSVPTTLILFSSNRQNFNVSGGNSPSSKSLRYFKDSRLRPFQ